MFDAEGKYWDDLPSFLLWDARAWLSDYTNGRTGLGPDDVGWVGPAFLPDQPASDDVSTRVQMYMTPQARRVAYPFGYRFHFAMRDPGDAQPAGQIVAGLQQNGVTIAAGDVPLAMFCGLIHEQVTASVDTYGHAIDTMARLLVNEYSDVASGNYYGAAEQLVGYIITQNQLTEAQNDANRYVIEITHRSFVPVVSEPQWSQALSAVTSAYASGNSIATALQSLADAGVRPSLFSRLAELHRENEERVAAAVNDLAFGGFAASQSADGAALRATWLQQAGAQAPSVYAQTLDRGPSMAVRFILAGSNRGPLDAGRILAGAPSSPQPIRSLRDAPLAPPPPPSSGHLDPFIQLGISILVGGVVGGVTGEVAARSAGLGAMAGATVGGLGYLGVRKLFPEHFTTNEPLPPETKIVQ